MNEHHTRLKKLGQRATRLYQNCIVLSLVTPVLAEAFINMLILAYCKSEIRDNQRQFDAFIRSNIDTKIFDLPYKCRGFSKRIDQSTEAFKNFKRVMDKRNNTLHGNIDPQSEKIETVYFEKKIPLYEEAGDHMMKFWESMEHLHKPQQIIKDYEDVHSFLHEIVECMDPKFAKQVWKIMQNRYPGFEVKSKRVGVLFSELVMSGYLGGLKYDDELATNWPKEKKQKPTSPPPI